MLLSTIHSPSLVFRNNHHRVDHVTNSEGHMTQYTKTRARLKGNHEIAAYLLRDCKSCQDSVKSVRWLFSKILETVK